MNPKLSNEDLIECELCHRIAGCGWVMIEDLDEEFCRVVMAGPAPKRGQAFLAAKDSLTVRMEKVEPNNPLCPDTKMKINPDSMEDTVELRNEIKDGTIKIVSTHFVKAK